MSEKDIEGAFDLASKGVDATGGVLRLINGAIDLVRRPVTNFITKKVAGRGGRSRL